MTLVDESLAGEECLPFARYNYTLREETNKETKKRDDKFFTTFDALQRLMGTAPFKKSSLSANWRVDPNNVYES
jgi:hypothetical protein